MRITIVTISFNQAQFLRQCIDSILTQTECDLEYIVVDPGSTDGSRELIESYGEQIIRVFEPDQGPADGLKGFAIATGDVFGFINADDALYPGALSKVTDTFNRQPSTEVVAGCGYKVDAEGKILERVIPTIWTPWLYLYGGVTIFQQGVFFRKNNFTLAGGFNINNKTCWDGELFLNFALKKARLFILFDNLALFRVHETSITGSGRLNTAYRLDQKRLFSQTVGHPPGKLTWILSICARISKWIFNPRYVFIRLNQFVWQRTDIA